VVILKRYLPAKKFGRCQFGLSGKDKMDCIYCDKCRYEDFGSTKTEEQKAAKIFLTCVLVVAVLISTISVNRFLQVIPAGLDVGAVSASGGEPRDIDLQRVRTLIQQKRLSDKEADFYKKIE
jgi:hypothetical protein